MAASSYDNFTAFYAQDPSVFGNTYETSVKIATVRLLDSQNNDTLNQKINAALHAIDTGQGDPESLINDLQAYVDDRFSAVGGPQLSPQEAVSYKHSHERGCRILLNPNTQTLMQERYSSVWDDMRMPCRSRTERN